MIIRGIAVCVDYADILERVIDSWMLGLDSLLIVTTPADTATHALIARYDRAAIFSTTAFYDNDAYFNKARALCEAIETMPWNNWFCTLDADILLPDNWREIFESLNPEAGYLYGAKRRQFETQRMIDDGPEMPSYFHIWHTSDQNVQRRPLYQIDIWPDAGGYDSEFHMRWPAHRRIWLPLIVDHLGDEPGVNWLGRKHKATHEFILQQRRQWQKNMLKRS